MNRRNKLRCPVSFVICTIMINSEDAKIGFPHYKGRKSSIYDVRLALETYFISCKLPCI